MMDPSLKLRKATRDDIPEMVDVLHLAFAYSVLNVRCYPPGDPATDNYWHDWCTRNINDAEGHLVLVEQTLSSESGSDEKTKKILGWTRWYPKPALPADAPRHIILRDSFPASGDPDLAVRFFQGNVDMMREVQGDSPFWYLSMLVVRPDAQRKGLGSMLMESGCEKADERGWRSGVTASAQGKGLYEKFGFRTAKVADYGDDIVAHAMVREVKGGL